MQQDEQVAIGILHKLAIIFGHKGASRIPYSDDDLHRIADQVLVRIRVVGCRSDIDIPHNLLRVPVRRPQ
ncbi:hypothetical protein BC938DRAFT_478397 [Jimgerdemannia flammicorona]|uniref:Uncharacterized protein n=1 Tax=Jimgerdemannia flammicorona TaxID=994334 RepID=A0A433QN09_9FUNG|nr:hypothetical protein BC938DRAFT_478397 [Jimgerdemannia flammicorona]